jgi:hypothetical protein
MDNSATRPHDSAAKETVPTVQKLHDHLNEAVEAGSTSEKHYHIRSAQQLLLAIESHTLERESRS